MIILLGPIRLPPYDNYSREMEAKGLAKVWDDVGGVIGWFKNAFSRNPPPELIEQGEEAIENYALQLTSEGGRYYGEAKLIIIGEPGVGKTTLANKILDVNYPLKTNEPSTESINVFQWQFEFERENTNRIYINIWDFGGQDIYRSLHRIFFTRRALYILVIDSRTRDEDVIDWLKQIEHIGDHNHVLLICNEKHHSIPSIDQIQLKESFPNIKSFIYINLADTARVNNLVITIRKHILELSYLHNIVPATWSYTRSFIRSLDSNYISLNEFYELCDKACLEAQDASVQFRLQEDKLQFSQFLHDTGVWLHFQHKPHLRRLVILKPEWITNAFYKLINDQTVKNNWGIFSNSDLDRIWNENSYRDMRFEFLSLLEEFEFCYAIPNEQGKYIAPLLLPNTQPIYELNGGDSIHVNYIYEEFQVKNIVIRLIVALHELIIKSKVWKTGAFLEYENAYAVIKVHGSSSISVKVSGDTKALLFEIIDYKLAQISAAYSNLKCRKFVACNCSVCLSSNSPEFHSLDKLVDRLEYGLAHIDCTNPPYETISIQQLIEPIVEKSVYQREKNFGIEEERHPKDYTKTLPQKIKVLLLAANPSDTARLRLDKEHEEIDKALQRSKFRDKFELTKHGAVQVSDLQRHLLRYEPTIVHFSGHGDASYGIALEDQTGNSQSVSSQALGKLFSVLNDNVQCVILNSCYSDAQAKAIAEHIDCVIGMSNNISDSTAIKFSSSFYQAIGYGRDVKKAFELGCVEVHLEDLGEQDIPLLIAQKIDPQELFFVK